ncbi:MAG TPA: MEDS domain-containing protein [Streptosporangiaceae bacterium]|nr:MEDS domain-containing protein [Streptosporangiaceae bacterium]
MQTWFARRPVRDLRPGDHAWLAFRSREEQEHVIGAFVHEGLAGTDRVVYITGACPRELPGLLTRYRTDPDPFAATGQLKIISPREACDADGRFDPDRLLDAVAAEIGESFAAGYRGVRITGDMTWAVRQPGGHQRVLGCERRMDATIAASTLAMAICQFGPHCCSPRQLDALEDTHAVIVEANPEFEDSVLRITRTFTPPGLRLEGELDAARHAAFAEALASVADVDRDVHLDLTGLRFLDLGALHLLTAFASRRRGGGRLLLDNLAPDLAAVIDTVGWHRMPGLAQGMAAHGQGAPS